MEIPLKVLFKLFEQAKIMEARQYREFLLIQRINHTHDDFFKYMHDRYLGMIYKEASELPPKPEETQVMDAGDPSVRNMLTSYSQKLRTARGYG